MHSATSTAVPDSDLTSEAKIRDAAIAHFARDGFRATNLRAIAATAGVSASLVIHHFGSKAQLQAVCDEYVLRTMIDRAHRKSSPAGIQGVMSEYFASPEGYQAQILYMGRAIAEDSAVADRFVESLVAECESVFELGIADGSMRAVSDVHGLAVLTVLNSLAFLTMSPALMRSLGVDGFGPDLLRRLSVPYAELYTHGLYTDDTVLELVRRGVSDQPDSSDGTAGRS